MPCLILTGEISYIIILSAFGSVLAALLGPIAELLLSV